MSAFNAFTKGCCPTLSNPSNPAVVAAPNSNPVVAGCDKTSSPYVSAGTYQALNLNNTFASDDKNYVSDGDKENLSTTDATRASRGKDKARQANESDDNNILPGPSYDTLARGLASTQGAQSHQTASPSSSTTPSRDPGTGQSSIDTSVDAYGWSSESEKQQAVAEALAVTEELELLLRAKALEHAGDHCQQLDTKHIQADIDEGGWSSESQKQQAIADALAVAEELIHLELARGQDPRGRIAFSGIQGAKLDNVPAPATSGRTKRHRSEVHAGDQQGQASQNQRRPKRQRQEKSAADPSALDGACHGNGSGPSRSLSSEWASSKRYDYAQRGRAAQPQLSLPGQPSALQNQVPPASSHAQPVVVPPMASTSASFSPALPGIAAALMSNGGKCPWTHNKADGPCQHVLDVSRPDLVQQLMAHIKAVGGNLF
ncbi:hypothetical protein BD626DRAFT_585808 [Schizophyllum amplum]|uniref:Uncharacterized protein n=1 Tax=Schizophyllum amplum TaxID=97359 RepID=A0A550C2V2_9AGAR|nr:hypothetical protein BD626DRAFT_585808 [Auriculariopsis ampla]